jgi:hypothetical protein
VKRLICTLAIAGAISASAGCAGILFDLAFNTVAELAEEAYYKASEPERKVPHVPQDEVVAP